MDNILEELQKRAEIYEQNRLHVDRTRGPDTHYHYWLGCLYAIEFFITWYKQQLDK